MISEVDSLFMISDSVNEFCVNSLLTRFFFFLWVFVSWGFKEGPRFKFVKENMGNNNQQRRALCNINPNIMEVALKPCIVNKKEFLGYFEFFSFFGCNILRFLVLLWLFVFCFLIILMIELWYVLPRKDMIICNKNQSSVAHRPVTRFGNLINYYFDFLTFSLIFVFI